MRGRNFVALPFALIFFVVLVLLLIILPFIIGEAFRTLGFGIELTVALFFFSLLGSVINIPVHTIRTRETVTVSRTRSLLGIIYSKPEERYRIRKTTIAINLGGALIPLLICIYLVTTNPELWLQFSLGVGILTLICYVLARPVPGVGITLPIFIPPLAAALFAILVPGGPRTIIAYVSGVMGVLIGGDILNLAKVSKYESKMLSIGGAGTFDGIFLTGIISVILAA
ncbi:hypothetical protein AKJ37_04840 [candidate division MSBL1 archaeon SCGC-AAA259I09]|uniref:DUF1614 domain-containing protein n=1 Tax=candidate division MSBL1 archaeon SCGC-AAA259I09 TaxID=1698267 RepID=A0A133UQV9_9EURY|nr:hypothetical protein AKJ37_04840 [candidate division MSBL1 archaeon SCGC-AAA259I09]